MSNEKFSKEAHAYTPGLKVKHAMTVSKTRRLPVQGEVLVKVGDSVDYNTIVARTQMSGDPQIVKAAMLLAVEPEELARYVTKKAGDRTAKNDVIAAYNAMFGLVKKRVVSPIEGTIESISETTGQIIIRGPPIPVEVNAYIPGRIVSILPREGAVIETNAAFIQGIFGIGGESHGKIQMGVNSPDQQMKSDDISSQYEGAVLVAGSLVTLETLKKMVEVGVSCVIAGGIRHKDLKDFVGREIGVAITGHEEVGLTLINTEGFGRMAISSRIFNLLRRFEGHLASVSGATQIRAGVLRPEIIIPHDEKPRDRTIEELTQGMVSGTRIRIIRQPHFGSMGTVVSLPAELQKLKSESHVRIVDVELTDGRVVSVPRANVEIIEE